jgi:surfactin synthase thioesterase subunit/glycosyltransferase involved in cell wall biosynthesis
MPARVHSRLFSAAGVLMRILLAHNSLYFPSHGGGDKSNRLLMEALAARGRQVRVVARLVHFGAAPQQQFLSELAARGVTAQVENGVVRFTLRGVDVRVLASDPHIRAYFSRQIETFDPDVIITSTDDPAQLLFEVAIQAKRARVVHLVRATVAAPFGPDASTPSPARTELLRRADAVVGVSEYVARYVREHGGMPAVHVPISLMEPGEYPDLGRFDSPYVVIVNPCAVKGIDIFIALAARMPSVQFAAVPTWGATAQDLAALRSYPNIAILPPVDDIEELLRQTRVLLVPSIWAEARSRVIGEAMLRGVPVIASDVGGIPEAKLGVPYVLPVNPIRRYMPALDENMVPVAERPPQDIAPWQAALERLITDPAHWKEIAAQSRAAALRYVANLSVEPFEALLEDLVRSPKPSSARDAPSPAPQALSDARRRLLAARLKQSAAHRSRWFPAAADAKPGQIRLFCFPHAGGGALAYRSWRQELPERFSVTPAQLPGREARISEPPVEDLAALIEMLTEEMQRCLELPCVFFGHSMGAVIAFELARSLRRNALPLPLALFASGARAPQFRENYAPPPEPAEAEFIAELRRLNGLPAEILDNPEAMRLLLPVLRADARLYRNYAYKPEPPFDFPIFAYGGAHDPNVRREHLQAWARQTTGPFHIREFAGGHFFLQTRRAEFLAALSADLNRLPG